MDTCWKMVRSMRLQAWKIARLLVQTCLASVIWLELGCIVKIWQRRWDLARKWDPWGGALAGADAANESKMSLQASTKGGCDGFAIGLAVSFFELGETRAGRIIAADFVSEGRWKKLF